MRRAAVIGFLVALAVVGGTVAGLAVGGVLHSGKASSSLTNGAGSSSKVAGAASPAAPAGRARPCARDNLVGQVGVPRVAARSAPSPRAHVISTFGRTNVQGSPQTFLVRGMVHKDGHTWYRALLPVRPNGTDGYLPGGSLRVARTPYRLLVVKHLFRLTLWSRCRLVRTISVGVGAGETPTPVGQFYLASLLQPPTADSVYGAYAYGLSGYSDVIRTWRWGGVIGLHGTNDPSSVGRRVSHGCIRMRNAAIESLVRILPLGTPVTIRA